MPVGPASREGSRRPPTPVRAMRVVKSDRWGASCDFVIQPKPRKCCRYPDLRRRSCGLQASAARRPATSVERNALGRRLARSRSRRFRFRTCPCGSARRRPVLFAILPETRTIQGHLGVDCYRPHRGAFGELNFIRWSRFQLRSCRLLGNSAPAIKNDTIAVPQPSQAECCADGFRLEIVFRNCNRVGYCVLADGLLFLTAGPAQPRASHQTVQLAGPHLLLRSTACLRR